MVLVRMLLNSLFHKRPQAERDIFIKTLKRYKDKNPWVEIKDYEFLAAFDSHMIDATYQDIDDYANNRLSKYI